VASISKGFGLPCAELTSWSSPLLLLAPLQELTEQGITIRLSLRRIFSGLSQVRLEIAAQFFSTYDGGAAQARQHLFGRDVSRPARNGGGQVHVAPLGGPVAPPAGIAASHSSLIR